MYTKIKKMFKTMFPNLTNILTLIKYKRTVDQKIRMPLLLQEDDYPAYLEEFYKLRTGNHLNLDNPQRFTEKIQWRKIYDRDIIYSYLSDKYKVRRWVEMKIGGEYLVPLLGHWKHFNEIDFKMLPNKFVLKANNGCHANIIVNNKKEFLRRQWSSEVMMEYWLRSLSYYDGLELHYRKIRPIIIAEQYLEPNMGEDCLIDYKFHCFNGAPFVCHVLRGRTTNETSDFYDMNWNHLPITDMAFPNTEKNFEKPQNYDLMIELATKLCQGFQYVRVDLYSTDKVYFGEMTFTHANGVENYIPDQWDFILGKQWNINTAQIDYSAIMDKKI